MKYRKKPVVIEAFQFGHDEPPQWFKDWIGKMAFPAMTSKGGFAGYGERAWSCDIVTLEGVMKAEQGDWIIKGITGELYPCKDHIFRETYEPAGESGVTA